MGITVEGAVKFVAQDFWKEEDDVLHASVEFSDIESTEADVIPLGDEYTALSELLRNLEDHPLVAGRNLSIDYSDLRQLGWRLSELIPLGIDVRQELLELNDPVERLSKIEKLVSKWPTIRNFLLKLSCLNVRFRLRLVSRILLCFRD